MGSSDLRSAAQQALEAFEGGADSWRLVGPAIDALKAALAEPTLDDAMAIPRARAGAYERGWNAAKAELTVTALQQALVETDLIDPDAIDDPDGYDGGMTLEQIDALHQRLTA